MLLSTLTSISSYALFLPLCSPHRVIVLFLPTIKRPPATISALTGTTFALCSNDFQTPLQFLFGVLTEQQLCYSMLLFRVLNWSTRTKLHHIFISLIVISMQKSIITLDGNSKHRTRTCILRHIWSVLETKSGIFHAYFRSYKHNGVHVKDNNQCFKDVF